MGPSLKDDDEFGRFEDKVFGYLSAGVSLSLALAFIPPDFGTWVVKGGVQILVLGDALTTIDDGDEVQVIGTLGPACAY